MFKFPLPKLLKWFIRRSLILLLIFFILIVVHFSLFANQFNFSKLFFYFSLGVVASSIIFVFLFLRFLLYPLARTYKKVQTINKGKDFVITNEDSYLDEEPGEFYELNKNLNQINNSLKWQKQIIFQESSELDTVISALTEAILAIDQNKKVLFFNNQATLLFSSHRKSFKTEILLSEMIRNPDILQAYNECLQKKMIVKKTLSIGVFDAEEEESVYEVTVAPLKHSDSGVHGAVGLFYDITNIKITEKIQLDFITNVSHELRTPLTAIQGYVETLLQEFETNNKEQIKQFLGIISRNVQRLVSLLNHFLDLAKMEDSMNLKKETLSTKTITNSIINDLHIKNHKIKLDFSQETVKADQFFLKQVLYNLIDNAIKYVPKGRLIEIIWTKKENDVVLIIKDHGEGISSRHKNRLFERFYRVDPARQGTKGAGIGLSIVKKLIEKHGGTIKIKSEQREGSSFICNFPD